MSAIFSFLGALGWRAYAALAVALALAGTHWYAFHEGAASRNAEIAQIKTQQAQHKADHATAALAAQQQIDAGQQAKTQAVAQADQTATEEVNHAKQHHQADRAALAAGTLRVRLNGADCAAADAGRAVPTPTTAASVADAAGVGLPASVGQSVLDLRFAIERDAAQISGLQSYIRAIVGDAPASEPMTAASPPLAPASEQ
jgi:hypothetical protein